MCFTDDIVTPPFTPPEFSEAISEMLLLRQRQVDAALDRIAARLGLLGCERCGEPVDADAFCSFCGFTSARLLKSVAAEMLPV